jgi:glucokinase
MILAGDIGGTKTNLACFSLTDGRLHLHTVASYPSQQYPHFEDILQKFIAGHPSKIALAVFGIAGPVIDGRCEATNLPWVVDARTIGTLLLLEHVLLLNDLEATAYGVLRLEDKDRLILNPGKPKPQGVIAVIAAGTGLGEGGLVWDGHRYKALASEGGHADFAPRNELEMDLLRFMLKRHERVSCERLLSGPGLHALYQFYRERASYPEPAWLQQEMSEGDPSAAISRTALEKKDEACVQALEMFVSLYGAEAGNLALKLLPTNGVYVGGGIAPKILPKIRDGSFLQSFTHKGRFSQLLSSMPVYVILNDKTALYGAAHFAVMMSE